MIRINLLQVPKARKVKKAAEAQFEIFIAGVSVVVVVAICFFYLFSLNGKVDRLVSNKNMKKKELAALQIIVKEVENFEKNKKQLEDRNRIIEQLRKNQGAPVRLLDQLSLSLEPLKVWLISMSVNGNQVDVEGRAITNSDIVDLINRLEATKFFGNILLIESRQTFEQKVPVYNFKLRFTMLI